MNLLSKYSIIFFLLFSSSAILVAQTCRAKIKISTDEKRALIYLNDEYLGEGEGIAELETGTYIIRASEPGNEWNRKVLYDTLIVNDCRTYNISFEFKKKIYLSTDPPDANVFAHDSLIGYTPLFISPSIREIILKKEEYADKSVLLAGPSLSKTVKLNFTGKLHNGNFFETPLFKILVGTAAVLGGTTAYFKLKADDKYSDYEISGEQSLLDQTRKNDLISGIAFGLLQVNFGLLIYYFLTE